MQCGGRGGSLRVIRSPRHASGQREVSYAARVGLLRELLAQPGLVRRIVRQLLVGDLHRARHEGALKKKQ